MLEVTNGSTTYGVYYVAANQNGQTKLTVPASGTPYEVSGNNKDGFIVTVTLSAAATVAPTETTAATEAAAPIE